MPYYESVFIARQDVSASGAETLADKFADLLKTNGGAVAKREYWGLRPLAYRIKKNKKGHYFLFNLEASPQTIQEMERNMRLDEDILRYLTLRIDEIEEAPSIMMQNRGRREEGNGDHGSSRPTGPAPREARSETPDETKAGESSGEEEASKEETSPDSAEESAAAAEEYNEGTAEKAGGQDESGENAS